MSDSPKPKQASLSKTTSRTTEVTPREFFESIPLYFRVRIASSGGPFSPPMAITLPCAVCHDVEHTTWRAVASHQCSHNLIEDPNLLRLQGLAASLTSPSMPRQHFDAPGYFQGYKCARCNMAAALFWYHLRLALPDDGGVELMKIGQWPSWTVQPSRAVRSALKTEDLDLYKKGRICLSQGYGVAAFAYFRRVIENYTEAFLDMIDEEAKAEGDKDLSHRVTRLGQTTPPPNDSNLPPKCALQGSDPEASTHLGGCIRV